MGRGEHVPGLPDGDPGRGSLKSARLPPPSAQVLARTISDWPDAV